MTARRYPVVVLVAGCLLLASCSIQTAGAPTGDTTIHAVFDDVADLTPGHNVQASNVVVGSVRDVALDGYRARVEMSIVDDFEVPHGTEAVVRRTSLLGEHYVDLVLPADFDPDSGPFVDDGATLADASTQPDVEQLAEQAATIVGSLTANDLGATVDAAAIGLSGRGGTLNQLVQDAGAVASVLADQQGDIGATVTALEELGSSLAPEADEFTATVDALNEATQNLAGDRDRIITAVEALVDMSRALNDTVIDPHAETLEQMLRQLEPLLGALADRTDILVDLIVDLGRFVERFPDAVHDGVVLLQAWAYIDAANLIDGLVPVGDPLDELGDFLQGSGQG